MAEVRRAIGNDWTNWGAARLMAGGSDIGWLGVLAAGHTFAAADPGMGVDLIPEAAQQYLPEGIPHYPDDQLTDKPMRFIVSEIIREKLFRSLTQELPYSITVDVEHYKTEADLVRISASIWVERKSQKGIVIGKGGKRLKQIGSDARRDIERLVESKVFLQLWVKVREDWSDDERSLAAFGYSSE